MITIKKTMVLGASAKLNRYSNKAVRQLIAHGHQVIAIGKRNDSIEGIPIITGQPEISDLDTITLYLNENNQKEYYNYIMALNPKRIIFNPGTENDELMLLAQKKNIDTIEACTLVLLASAQY